MIFIFIYLTTEIYMLYFYTWKREKRKGWTGMNGITKQQEKTIASKMLLWLEYTIIKIVSNYAVIMFEDDEQRQCYWIYTDGQVARQW